MPFMKLPNAAASIAFDFPIAAVAAIASLVLIGIVVMGLLDFRKTPCQATGGQGRRRQSTELSPTLGVDESAG